jgi:hypothetical protein
MAETLQFLDESCEPWRRKGSAAAVEDADTDTGVRLVAEDSRRD